MTLYDYIKKISDILTPDTGYFYEYCMHHCDDNGGFLRSCYRWKEEQKLRDRPLHSEKNYAVVSFEKVIDENSFFAFTDIYSGNLIVRSSSNMQFFYTSYFPFFMTSTDEVTIEEEIEANCGLGFYAAYIIDFDKGTYEIDERNPLDYP